MPNEAPSSFVFVFIDSWKRQHVRLTAFHIKVSLMLVEIFDGFFMLFHMRFLTGTVRRKKELTRQQDKHHRVVSYSHTIPRWCSGQLKYEILLLLFQFPYKGLDTTINWRVFIAHCHSHIRRFSAKAGNTPQDVLNINNCLISYSLSETKTIICHSPKSSNSVIKLQGTSNFNLAVFNDNNIQIFSADFMQRQNAM